MKKYILLVDLSFDWSSGEYGNSNVENIYLKTFKCEKKEDAIIECKKEFQKRFEDDDGSCQGFHYTYGIAEKYKALEI
jgi:hypothetical protein